MLSNDVYVGTSSRVHRLGADGQGHIGEGAVVKRAIIDKNVKVPAGAAIGLDPELDRARGFKVTDSGITVLSKGQVVPEPGDAERALSAANLHLVPDAVKRRHRELARDARTPWTRSARRRPPPWAWTSRRSRPPRS